MGYRGWKWKLIIKKKPKQKTMKESEAIARVMHVNRTLRAKGYSWEEIEAFLDRCIEETKQTCKD